MPLHTSEYNYSVHTYSCRLSEASLITLHYFWWGRNWCC